MKVTVCIGSSCHLTGSRKVVEELKRLISEGHLEGKVELAGTFCLGQCQRGVCVTIGDEIFSVTPETVDEFFQSEIVSKL